MIMQIFHTRERRFRYALYQTFVQDAVWSIFAGLLVATWKSLKVTIRLFRTG